MERAIGVRHTTSDDGGLWTVKALEYFFDVLRGSKCGFVHGSIVKQLTHLRLATGENISVFVRADRPARDANESVPLLVVLAGLIDGGGILFYHGPANLEEIAKAAS